MEAKYYDGTKLLSMKDINGKTPEIFLCTTNRTGGKTTYFGRLLVNRFIKSKKRFILLYRFNYEIGDVAQKFFNDIQSLFFPTYEMTDRNMGKGTFKELFLNDISCGYAIALNTADTLKKYSHLFSDIDSMLFDEFQSETNHYCPQEIRKLISIHTSVARGQGKQVRYVPIYMLSNSVSLLNPYYAELGISSRLRSDTQFLRGDGFILEQGFIESAANAQMESGFNRAFSSNDYVKYARENVYLNDNTAFIEKPKGNGKYVATIKFAGKHYGVREYAEKGIIYVDNNADMSFPLKIVTQIDDHNVNYIMLKRSEFIINNFRYFFERGCFRFKDLQSKEALLTTISYK